MFFSPIFVKETGPWGIHLRRHINVLSIFKIRLRFRFRLFFVLLGVDTQTNHQPLVPLDRMISSSLKNRFSTCPDGRAQDKRLKAPQLSGRSRTAHVQLTYCFPHCQGSSCPDNSFKFIPISRKIQTNYIPPFRTLTYIAEFRSAKPKLNPICIFHFLLYCIQWSHQITRPRAIGNS